MTFQEPPLPPRQRRDDETQTEYVLNLVREDAARMERDRIVARLEAQILTHSAELREWARKSDNTGFPADAARYSHMADGAIEALAFVRGVAFDL